MAVSKRVQITTKQVNNKPGQIDIPPEFIEQVVIDNKLVPDPNAINPGVMQGNQK